MPELKTPHSLYCPANVPSSAEPEETNKKKSVMEKKVVKKDAFLTLKSEDQVKVNNYIVLHNVAQREFESMSDEAQNYILSLVVQPKIN